jgi:SOS-response transcriptional repressor LexA
MPAMNSKQRHPSMERLLEAAAKRGAVGPAAVASALGESDQTITNWASRGVSKGGAIKVQQILGISSTWITTGEGDVFRDENRRQEEVGSNIEPGPDARGPYPLISQVQAGMWTELQDNFQPGDADEWLPSTKNLGPHGYMLRVVGKSMENPGGRPSFPEGMILHVKPGCVPVPGQFVIVRREHTKEATFKKFILIEGSPYLEAINPDWPKDEKYLKLQPGDEWCGIVVDASLGGLP